MREGLKLSSMLFVVGLLVLFQKATLLKLDFFMMLLLALAAVFWCEAQLRKSPFRLAHYAILSAFAYYTVSAIFPVQMPSGLGNVSNSLYVLDHIGLKLVGAQAFFNEIYDYATNPDKLDFYHWQYLSVVFVLVFSELLYQIHRKGLGGLSFLIAFISTGFLWFTYLDVWAVFACFFMAYATERLTRQGKGALFGLILPVGITVAALMMTGITPVETINEKLSPLTSENGWLRTALNVSPGTGVFQLREMGFYPLGNRLGGPVKLTKDIIFRVKSATPKIYLRGRVLTLYEESQWKRVDHKPGAFYTIGGNPAKMIDYTLYDLKTKTNSVLVPMTVSSIGIAPEKLQYGNDGEVLYAGNLKSDYKAGFQVIGYQQSYEGLGSEKSYLKLPANYSPKVVSLTKEVIKGSKSDEEKIKKIRKYLLNNYTYALAVAMPPEDQDFVEYFLTEADSGYCVYFATATAVMARVAGLPSRYVEGFVTPETFEAGRDAAVSGERAHAWAEVYYNHQWQIVESTPTFTNMTEFDQTDAPLKSDLLEPEKQTPSGKEETDMDVPLPIETDNGAEGSGNLFWLGWIGLVMMILGGLSRLKFIAYFKGSTKILQDRYVALLLAGLTQQFGLQKPQTLSPREIIRYCDRSGPSLNLMSIVEIVEKSLYDSSDISDQELELLAQTYWQLYRTRFAWGRKLYWYVKIAWKGRVFNGNDGKSSTS